MAKVFISHSSRDQDFVETEIIPLLHRYGVHAWYSKDDIQTASDWEKNIRSALKSCDWFLVVMSPHATESPWVQCEVHWALEMRQDRIVPVMLKTCDPIDLHLKLVRIQYVDFRRDIESARTRLLSVWGIRYEPQEHTIDSKYRLLAHLGTGEFGDTYKALVLDEYLVREWGTEVVALKIPRSRKMEHLVQNEVLAYASSMKLEKNISCPHVVKYFGFDVFRGRIAMVVEYCEGGSLRDQIGPIGQQIPQPVGQALRITAEILRGLAVIHELHMMHRDIRPEHILIHREVYKVADWGLSRLFDAGLLLPTDSSEMGTCYYISPEMIKGESLSYATDVWSVGAVLYEMLAGCGPFGSKEKGINAIIDQVLSAQQVPLQQIRPDVPVGISEMIDCALEKMPEKRFPNANAMLEVLNGLHHADCDSK